VRHPRISRETSTHPRTRNIRLFGDYDPELSVIRVWMRTAVRKEVTSFGTFLSTLCHEFCQHLDFKKFGFVDSWHTRGFYERAAVLYHLCAVYTTEKAVLGSNGRPALANRLAADASGFVTQWLWVSYWYSPSGHPLQWFPYFETRKYRTDHKQSFDN
jgi:hypothetical protein